jgi:uncharacterized membrane protein
MKFLAFALLTSLASVSAHAEKFECGFTEPFYTLKYDTTTRLLSLKDEVMSKARIIRGVEFAIEASNEFSLRKGDKELARIKLTNEGSDGMSSTIYPFEISTSLLGGANNGIGGCASSLLLSQEGQP